MNELKLPVGIDGFEKIRRNGFYYIDKTELIEQLFLNWGEVNLFTRPRRFGKTLNMSMLKCFFEIGTDSSLFDGLYISEKQTLCEQHLGKYPVIFLSLKGVEGLNFSEAKRRCIQLIRREAERFYYLKDSERLLDLDKKKYHQLLDMKDQPEDVDIVISSIKTLSDLLYKHYGKKTVILIDEYDVPLDKAFQHGYYKEMIYFTRGLLGEALKTNDSLNFAVLTGCLRVSKESIFTGLNNFKILSITDTRFDEQFGFTDTEVRKLLSDYHLEDRFAEVKEWYDGYRFGKADVYCPWDVVNFVDRVKDDPEARPEAYWINTSGNDLVKRFIDKANKTTKNEIERLINGEAIEKELRLDLTYEEFLNKITVTTQNDTRILSITVKDEDPYVASQMADAIRVAASDHIQNVMNTEAVNVVDEANIPDEPVSPSIKKNGLIGAIAGAFIAIVIIIIVYLTNDTIQTSEDVERYLGVSTLGIIPLAEGQKKSKKKNKNGRGRKK